MACSVVRSPLLLRNSAVRHYAVAAAAQSAVAITPETQVLGNKVTVAALDNNSPVTHVSVVFRAGSRNETYETQGITHHLRIAAGMGTARASAFGITRNVQQLGGNITATVDRESIAYTLQITRDNLNAALPFLEDVATQQVFKPWEISDQEPRLRYELSSIPETTRVLELLHKAAYRRGLGYSLYSPKRQLGKISTETLQHFVNTWFTGTRCAVVATGVPLAEVSAFADHLNVGSQGANDEASRYYGGELRKERNSQLTTLALAVEGASLKNEKESLAYAVLQRAIGTGPRVKWGNSPSPLYKAVSSVAGSEAFGLTSFNASYTDSGLFGFVLCCLPSAANTLTKAAHKCLKAGNLSDSDIARGQLILKSEILSAADRSASVINDLSQQVLLKGKPSTVGSLIADIENLSASDVKSVAGKLGGKPVSLAAIGDLSTVPYIDQLN